MTPPTKQGSNKHNDMYDAEPDHPEVLYNAEGNRETVEETLEEEADTASRVKSIEKVNYTPNDLLSGQWLKQFMLIYK